MDAYRDYFFYAEFQSGRLRSAGVGESFCGNILVEWQALPSSLEEMLEGFEAVAGMYQRLLGCEARLSEKELRRQICEALPRKMLTPRPEPMLAVLPELSADVITILCNEGSEVALQRFPELQGQEALLNQIIETENAIAALEGQVVGLKAKADGLGANLKAALDAAALEASC